MIGLAKVRLTSSNRDLGAAVGHCLVLQRAFAALVAHRAVQRMVDQQQLHHAVLGLVGGRRGELGAHHHVVGGHGMVHDAIGLRWPSTSTRHLPARADRVEQRVVAEPRDLDAHQLGGTNHQGALGTLISHVVDGQRHHLRRGSAWSASVSRLWPRAGHRARAPGPRMRFAAASSPRGGLSKWGRCRQRHFLGRVPAWSRAGRTGSRLLRRGRLYSSRKMLDRRDHRAGGTIAQRAERLSRRWRRRCPAACRVASVARLPVSSRS